MNGCLILSEMNNSGDYRIVRHMDTREEIREACISHEDEII